MKSGSFPVEAEPERGKSIRLPDNPTLTEIVESQET